MNNNDFIVVIPAWNEEESIGCLLETLDNLSIRSMVVDDGSEDRTSEIVKTFNTKLIQHHKNLGYENALSTGIHKAADDGYKYAITMDADGQIDTKDILRFVRVAREERSDVVIGIRDYRNRFCERILCLFGQLRFRIKDPLCGIKLYKLKKAKQFFPFDSHKLVGMELAFRMSEVGMKISQINISIKVREGLSRYGSSIKGELRILKSLYKAIILFGFTQNENILRKKNR